MRARVRAESPMPIIRSAGLMWTRNEWREVPERAAAEIMANPFLETEGGVQLPLTDEPVTPASGATKLVYPRKRARKV